MFFFSFKVYYEGITLIEDYIHVETSIHIVLRLLVQELSEHFAKSMVLVDIKESRELL